MFPKSDHSSEWIVSTRESARSCSLHDREILSFAVRTFAVITNRRVTLSTVFLSESGAPAFEALKDLLLEIALELERIALQDEYFVTRKLYPNVDFYTGLIYQSMGFPVTMFPVLFAIPRTSGWLAQWEEMLLDPEQKIARPRQLYLGYDKRSYVGLEQRS